MVRYPHEPTDKQIERWYNKMSLKQKSQLDKDVEEAKEYIAKMEAEIYNSKPDPKIIKFIPPTQNGQI